MTKNQVIVFGGWYVSFVYGVFQDEAPGSLHMLVAEMNCKLCAKEVVLGLLGHMDTGRTSPKRP